MSLSFEDFRLFTKAPDVDIKVFAAIAPGALAHIENVYGIYFTKNIATIYRYFPLELSKEVNLPVAPLNDVISITIDGIDQGFSFYGENITLDISLTSLTIPLICTIDTGYDEVPADLILAVFQYIESLYFRYKNSLDNVSKVINTSGNTTHFRDDVIPELSKMIFNRYSNRLVALY